ncbi:hypothetical protein DSO57_1022412 [Entomophthora muscae]|uniref:Uncharacterized protein n=1 Tax=Entomophthora muscae TaxID=34485 RepID=A0ACC2S5A5_9FUNG|nr:hypothetical protein DSO57_1022412 [Entomophthora muscae]
MNYNPPKEEFEPQLADSSLEHSLNESVDLSGAWAVRPDFFIGGSVPVTFRTDNFSPLEPQAQEQESNPEPGSPWAARPEDCETACPHFSGIKPPQADVEEDDPPRKVD